MKDIRVMGRATQGVRLINLRGKDEIAAVAKVEHDDSDDIEGYEGEENSSPDTDGKIEENTNNEE